MGYHTKFLISSVPEGNPVYDTGIRSPSHIPGVECTGRGTRPAVANRLFYEPIFVSSPITIDEIMVGVTTGHASSIRLGIYTADPEWQPEDLVIDAGTVDCTLTGPKIISLVPALLLPANRYLLARLGNGTPTLRNVHGGNRYAGYSDAEDTNPFVTAMRVNHAFGALPDPGLKWDTREFFSTPFQYHVRVRILDPAP